MKENMQRKTTFSLVSLGCAKNLVNSEQMHHLMREAGFVPVAEADGADLAVDRKNRTGNRDCPTGRNAAPGRAVSFIRAGYD